jgi:ribonuclease HII
MAGVTLTNTAKNALQEAGVEDSKFLSTKQREELYPAILKYALNYKIIILEPHDIDIALQSPTTNLNWLEAEHAASIVNELHPHTAIIDCPSPNITAYHAFVKKKLNYDDIKLILEHKAEKHIPVAAASILAKVTRDRIIQEMKKTINIDFGSGYMSDEKTQLFLQRHHTTHKTLFRQSWQSYKDIITKKQQTSLQNF